MNPISFNPDTMTLTKIKYCVDVLRTVFNLLERKADDSDIVRYIEQARDQMITLWGEPK